LERHFRHVDHDAVGVRQQKDREIHPLAHVQDDADLVGMLADTQVGDRDRLGGTDRHGRRHGKHEPQHQAQHQTRYQTWYQLQPQALADPNSGADRAKRHSPTPNRESVTRP
jgi:hypothetical protein